MENRCVCCGAIIPEERIAALKRDNAELLSAIEALISGVTE